MNYIENPPIDEYLEKHSDEYFDERSDEFLEHYGVGHLNGGNSGRYPWGSGDNKFQHYGDYLSRVRELKAQHPTFTETDKRKKDYGVTYTGETAIAKILGYEVLNTKDYDFNTSEYRLANTLAKNLERMAKVNRAEALAAAVDENGKPKYGYSEIARKMGLPNESSVRSLLEPNSIKNMMMAQDTANFIKDRLNELAKTDPKAMIDLGPGAENDITEKDLHLDKYGGDVARELGISRKKLQDAVYLLEGEGYQVGGSRIPNMTDPTGARQTTLNVIGLPTMEKKDVYQYDHIYSLKDYISRDGGKTFEPRFEYPESLDSSRLKIRYAEEGGVKKDGIIELRRGVPDLSLGESNYAQVRILVDGEHYLKGMAVYSDNLPKGVDVLFNTNKSVGTPMEKVLKPVKRLKDGSIDRDNPFGSLIKDKDQGGQYHYTGEDGKQHLGLINKRADEGDWGEWKDTLASQFLSKQPIQLAQRQLNAAIREKQQEFKEIMALNNNTVKKLYLETFASDCDSTAVHLKAASLPRQKFQVLLALETAKDTECYAPNYPDGTQLALIRYPHGGPFEIPIVTVNNKLKEGQKVIGKNSKDAIGINAAVASRLSGADYDGDTAMVVPLSKSIKIKSVDRDRFFPGLVDFEPKTIYGPAEVKVDSKGKEHYYNAQGLEYKIMKNTNIEMGKISNLITDMYQLNATPDEIARAVRHSMVVIDAAKHKLDYRSSYQREKIDELKKSYQLKYDEDGNPHYGSATLLSLAKSPVNIKKTEGQPKVNIKGTAWYDPSRPEGALIYKTASKDKLEYYTMPDPSNSKKSVNVYKRKDGSMYYLEGPKNDRKQVEIKDTSRVKTNIRTQSSTQMEQTDDARTLMSPARTPMEQVYASFANTMKSLANEARKAAYFTKGVAYSPSAAKVYSKEVEDLDIALDKSLKNKPRERQAQIIARSSYNAKIEDDPSLTKEDKRKIRQQCLSKARDLVGAKREQIKITDKQWEAIQAGAIHANKLEQILSRADMDTVREKATPQSYKTVTAAMISRMKNMANDVNKGYTNADIAAALGVSVSTVSKYLKEDKNQEKGD